MTKPLNNHPIIHLVFLFEFDFSAIFGFARNFAKQMVSIGIQHRSQNQFATWLRREDGTWVQAGWVAAKWVLSFRSWSCMNLQYICIFVIIDVDIHQ